jgi:hypothetical protein
MALTTGLLVLLARAQQVALEVHPATLPASTEHPACGRFQILMRIADTPLARPVAAARQPGSTRAGTRSTRLRDRICDHGHVSP